MSKVKENRMPLMLAAAAVGIYFLARPKGMSNKEKIEVILSGDTGQLTAADRQIAIMEMNQMTDRELDLLFRIMIDEASFPLNVEDELLFEIMQIKYTLFGASESSGDTGDISTTDWSEMA